MTTIKCGVKKCAYNEDGGCKLEKIKVGTSGATMCDETKCESFTECSDCTVNSCGCKKEPCDCATVNCSAHNCRYNDLGKCEARKIEIATCHAQGCGQTECHTFSNK